MRKKPTAVLFNALGTLFSLEPVRHTLLEAGLPEASLELALARTLRDGFALESAGIFRKFQELLDANLETLFAAHSLESTDEMWSKIHGAFDRLPAYPDVLPALRALREAGIRIGILTNGGEASCRKTMEFNGVVGLIEEVTSIDHVFRWKPAREVYHHGARALGVPLTDLALVAAHAWDIAGAHEAGLMTAFVRRDEPLFPDALITKPDVAADSLLDIAQAFGAENAEQRAPQEPIF